MRRIAGHARKGLFFHKTAALNSMPDIFCDLLILSLRYSACPRIGICS